MISERLRTLRQLAERNPAFSESALRWHVFNAKRNGLDSSIVRVGRRVLIDEQAFSRWLERRSEAQSAGREGADAMSPVTIHPSARAQLMDWLDEAADEAADTMLYPNPYLAAAFRDLADEVRRANPVSITTCPQEGSTR